MKFPFELRLLIDAALSPRLAELLRAEGIDTVHVRELGMARALDSEILRLAADEKRVLVSRDADFAGLIALGALSWPSFVHLRIPGLNDPVEQARLLLDVLDQVRNDLHEGAIVTIRRGGIRVRSLPL